MYTNAAAASHLSYSRLFDDCMNCEHGTEVLHSLVVQYHVHFGGEIHNTEDGRWRRHVQSRDIAFKQQRSTVRCFATVASGLIQVTTRLHSIVSESTAVMQRSQLPEDVKAMLAVLLRRHKPHNSSELRLL